MERQEIARHKVARHKVARHRMAQLLALSAPAQDESDPWHAVAMREFLMQTLTLTGLGKGRVLDIGCGTALVGEMFEAEGWEYLGVGVSESDLHKARGRGLRVSYAEMSDLALFPDDSFDLIWCRHALEHALALPLTLLEMRRLAPLAAVVVPAPPAWLLQPGHFYTMERAAWVHLFVQCGWRAEAVPSKETREYRWILRREP